MASDSQHRECHITSLTSQLMDQKRPSSVQCIIFHGWHPRFHLPAVLRQRKNIHPVKACSNYLKGSLFGEHELTWSKIAVTPVASTLQFHTVAICTVSDQLLNILEHFIPKIKFSLYIVFQKSHPFYSYYNFVGCWPFS